MLQEEFEDRDRVINTRALEPVEFFRQWNLQDIQYARERWEKTAIVAAPKRNAQKGTVETTPVIARAKSK